MSQTTARATFDEAISRSTDPEQVARLELAREYFTDPDFRAWLEAQSFRRQFPTGESR